jgi:hypothetical protein
MDESVEQILERLTTARDAVDVFGPAGTEQELRRAYREAAKRCHPDRCAGDDAAAREAFTRLTRWHEMALEQLRAGRYGREGAGATGARPRIIHLRNKERVYAVNPAVAFRGDFANVYRALHEGSPVAVKVVRLARDNDLLVAERSVLRRIAREVEDRFHCFFPRLLDGFAYSSGGDRDGENGREERAANVLSWVGGAYTLDEIRQAYPTGVDPKDVAWMWRRLLAALGAAHRAGIVHGGVLPPHVCVLPDEHGLVLIGWTCAVEAGLPAAAITEAYERWYPKEVMTKEPVTAATDLAMGARCMEFLLPEDAPAALSRFFRGCMLPSSRQRPRDAWALLREFDEVLTRLWGARRFHPFAVPAPCPR